jgi:hypothetical protein
MTQTTYEILALLERHFEDSVTLLKQLTTCPGQRADILIPLSNELRYVRAQIGFEVTEQASGFEMQRANYWGRIHRTFKERLKDLDDIYLEIQEREKQRMRKSLAPRLIILPWSSEEEENLLAASGPRPERCARTTGRMPLLKLPIKE